MVTEQLGFRTGKRGHQGIDAPGAADTGVIPSSGQDVQEPVTIAGGYRLEGGPVLPFDARQERVVQIAIVAEARNGREALKTIRELQPDLVFLDIQMPGMGGFEMLAELRQENMPAIVFVTAYNEYAIEAFQANALDYLLKPIEDSRLHEAIFRVRENLDQKHALRHKQSLLRLVSNMTGKNVSSMQELSTKGIDRLMKKEVVKLVIKDGGRTTLVPQDQIEWIDAAGDYMCVHAGGETHIMRKTMKELEAELDPDLLQRIHRSTIVNVNQVREMQSHINGEIGRAHV